MMQPVVWQQAAREDLAALIGFIAGHSTQAAHELMQRIEACVVPLAVNPYMGRPGRVPGTRELLAHPNYWVIYQVGAVSVEIVSVLHARRQYP